MTPRRKVSIAALEEVLDTTPTMVVEETRSLDSAFSMEDSPSWARLFPLRPPLTRPTQACIPAVTATPTTALVAATTQVIPASEAMVEEVAAEEVAAVDSEGPVDLEELVGFKAVVMPRDPSDYPAFGHRPRPRLAWQKERKGNWGFELNIT
jgi:hypothetical protein